MSMSNIGESIANLRREKGATQDDLARAVGVSAQAVSKWENGGMPDAELLPVIADYFNVSIDALFGRETLSDGNLHAALFNYIADFEGDTSPNAVFTAAMEVCWALEKAMMSNPHAMDNADFHKEHLRRSPTLQEILDNPTVLGGLPKDTKRLHSALHLNGGFTQMSLMQNLQYFLLMPEPPQGWNKALLEPKVYTDFFKLLGDEDVFNALLLMHRRENYSATTYATAQFSLAHLASLLSITEERTEELVAQLIAWNFMHETASEIDDKVTKYYEFKQHPLFVAILVLVGDLVNKPRVFSAQAGVRTDAYLR